MRFTSNAVSQNRVAISGNSVGEGVARPRPNPRKKVVGNRGFGEEPAGAFDNANRDANATLSLAIYHTDDSNAHTVGYAVAPPTAIVVKHIRASFAYLNRIARAVQPCNLGTDSLYYGMPRIVQHFHNPEDSLLWQSVSRLVFLKKRASKNFEARFGIVKCYCNLRMRGYAFFTLSTIALKAAGLLRARSARTLRLISMPALWMRPISLEYERFSRRAAALIR